MTVILAEFNEPVDRKKPRLVTVYKAQVYRDIDLLTHKHAEGSGLEDMRVRNAIESDFEEPVDGAIITRNVEYRDAKLRKKITFALADKYDERASDIMELSENAFVYNLVVPEEWNDNLLDPLADQFHRFLVYGALYDWYAQIGSRQAEYYKSQVEEIQGELVSTLRTPSIAKRPLQPFGPAQRMS